MNTRSAPAPSVPHPVLQGSSRLIGGPPRGSGESVPPPTVTYPAEELRYPAGYEVAYHFECSYYRRSVFQ